MLKLNKATFISIVLFALIVFSCSALSQPTDLTDRELLIQLYGKMESIEKSIIRIENNSKNVNENTVLLEKRITKNEINIAGFYEKLSELVSRWNTLLGLFVTFVTGIFVWMWRKVYNEKRTTKPNK